jgi:hypothetical protein
MKKDSNSKSSSVGRAAHSALIERARRTDLLALNATVRAVLAELQGETRALLSALEALPAESKGELESVA